MTSKTLPFWFEPPPAAAFESANYIDLFRLTWNPILLGVLRNQTGADSPSRDYGALLRYSPNIGADIGCAAIGAIIFTIVRIYCARTIIPFLLRHQLIDTRDGIRVMESLYMITFATVSFILSSIIVTDYEYFAHPERLWSDFTFADTIPPLHRTLYIVQLAHYMHSAYAVLRLNQWTRTDSIVMLCHHLLAIALLVISLTAKMHRTGVMILYLFDICDILLDSTKCLIKLRVRGTSAASQFFRGLIEATKVALFVALLFFWFRFRLYHYPLRVIYPAVLCFAANPIDRWFPLSVTMLALMWLILALNVYWAYLLLRILYNTLVGGSKEIEDIRDEEDIAELRRRRKKKE